MRKNNFNNIIEKKFRQERDIQKQNSSNLASKLCCSIVEVRQFLTIHMAIFAPFGIFSVKQTLEYCYQLILIIAYFISQFVPIII